MNFETDRRIEVARTEEEIYEKLEELKTEGYAENDIHVISKDRSHMHTLNRHSEVSTHEAGTIMDKFKSWFTGEDYVVEGLRKLDLNENERNRFAQDVASGGFVLYTDHDPIQKEKDISKHQNEFEEGYDTFGSSRNSYETYHDEQPVQPIEPGYEEREQDKDPQFRATSGTEFEDSRFINSEINELNGEKYVRGKEETKFRVEEPTSEYSKKQGYEKSTNNFVNQTDGRFDEPTDRFERGESFATNPFLAREVDHIGHSMQEDRMVQQHRPTIEKNNQNETITDAFKTEGYQSPGADPNLGPSAFGHDVENEFPSGDVEHDFEKDPRKTNYKTDTGYEENGNGNAFAFDTNSTNNEFTTGGVEGEEDITTDQYKEQFDIDKYRGENASSNKLL
jgi:hypothetical protein